MNIIQKKIIRNRLVENEKHNEGKKETKNKWDRLLMINRTIVSIDYF